MGKLIDETGKTYGKLKVLFRDPNPHPKPYWVCECECKEQISVYGNSLRSGRTTQCKKCSFKQAIQTKNGDLYKKIIGKHFNNITVIEEDLTKGAELVKLNIGNANVIAEKKCLYLRIKFYLNKFFLAVVINQKENLLLFNY